MTGEATPGAVADRHARGRTGTSSKESPVNGVYIRWANETAAESPTVLTDPANRTCRGSRSPGAPLTSIFMIESTRGTRRALERSPR